METPGSLVDKLTIANIRLWHLEDQRRDKSLTDAERLAAADAVSVVNRQRNDLVDELDKLLCDIIASGKGRAVPKVKLYGGE